MLRVWRPAPVEDVAALHLKGMYLIGDGVPRDHRKTVPVLTVVMS